MEGGVMVTDGGHGRVGFDRWWSPERGLVPMVVIGFRGDCHRWWSWSAWVEGGFETDGGHGRVRGETDGGHGGGHVGAGVGLVPMVVMVTKMNQHAFATTAHGGGCSGFRLGG